MEFFTNYFINPNTLVAIPKFINGKCCSFVLHCRRSLIVDMAPTELVHRSLLYFAKDLKGSCNGSKAVLGNVNMCPVIICSQLKMCWFPCSTPEGNPIWFAERHILDTIASGENQTDVILSYGHIVTVDMCKSRFDHRWGRATRLRKIVSERIYLLDQFEIDQPQGFIICRDPLNNFYDIKEDE